MLRFYLEETVSQDLNLVVSCSPAGLITEADFLPVRDKLENRLVPACTVAVETSELRDYLNSLPRFLTDNLTITVSGELNEGLNIHDFCGSGCIRIVADSASGFTANNLIYIANCYIPVQLWDIQMNAPANQPENAGLCNISFSQYVRLAGCTLTGDARKENTRGVSAEYGSVVTVEECTLSSFYTAVFAGRSSIVSLYGGASDYSGNTYGAQVDRGGLIMLSGGLPDTLGGSSNIKGGGMIVRADGTLL